MTLMMNRALLAIPAALFVSAAIVATPSCAAFSKAIPLVEPAGACIVTQLLEGGATDPLQIVAACAGVTIEDVIAVIEQLMAQQPDGSATSQRLASVHVRALGIKAAGHK